MFLAKELHKSLDEIMNLSSLELRMWAAFYTLEQKEQQKQQKKR
jgi:hypothetical protein